jgi:tetratricopeptide (TPR) repeat protein
MGQTPPSHLRLPPSPRPRVRRALAFLATALLVLCAPQTALSQKTLWETYIEGGRKAYVQGNYADAERLFKEALEAAKATGDKGIRLERSLLNLGTVYRDQAKYSEAEKLLKQAILVMEAGNLAEQTDMALALNNLAGLYQLQGRVAEAIELYNRSVRIAEKRMGSKNPELALELNNLAYVYVVAGKYADAGAVLRRSVSLFDNPKKRNSLYYAVTLFNLAFLDQETGNFANAEKLYKQALDVCEKTVGKDHRYTAGALTALGELYTRQGKYVDAEALLKRSLEIMERVHGPGHPEIAGVLHELGSAYLMQGKYQMAEPLCRKALEIAETALGPDHPGVASGLNDLAFVYQQQGVYSEAEPLLQRALKIRERKFGYDHAKTAQSMKHLAVLYQDEGKLEQSEALLTKALAIAEKQLGRRHADVAEIVRLLARVYARQGKYDLAEPLYKRSLAATEDALGADNVQYAAGLRDLGSLYQMQGKLSEAERLYLQVLAIDEKALGPGSARVASDLEALARVYTALGDETKARDMSSRADQIKSALPGAHYLNKLAESLGSDDAHGTGGIDRPVTDKWALVIGISNFKDPSVNLKYAAKDATDFRNFLVKRAGFQPDHVKLLTDSGANRENIVAQLGEMWLGRLANRDDLVVIYISSHASAAKQEAGGVNFLVAYDTSKNSLLSTGIPMQWLTNIIKEQVHSDRVVLIMDVCHGGAAAPGEKGLTRTAGLDLDQLNIGNGQAILCSSLADQVSWESKNYQNSVFTRRLLEALESNGDKTTLTEAYLSLRDAVESEVLRDRGELQTPVLNKKQWQGGDAVISVQPTRPRPGLR